MGVLFERQRPSGFEPIILKPISDKPARPQPPRLITIPISKHSSINATSSKSFPFLRLPLEVRTMIYRHLVLPSNFLFLSSGSYTEVDRTAWPKTPIHVRKSDYQQARDYWFNLPDTKRNTFYAAERQVCWDLLLVNKQVYHEATAIMRNESVMCIDVDRRFVEMLDSQNHHLRSRKWKMYLSELPPNEAAALTVAADATSQQQPHSTSGPSYDLLAYLATYRHLTLHISSQLSSLDLFHLTPLMTALRNAYHHHPHITLTTTRAYNPYEDSPTPASRSRGLKRLISGLKTILHDLGGPEHATLTLRIIDLRPTSPWLLDLDGLLDTFTTQEWEERIQEVVDEVVARGKGVKAESWCPDRASRKKWDERFYAMGYRAQQSFYPKKIEPNGTTVIEEEEGVGEGNVLRVFHDA